MAPPRRAETETLMHEYLSQTLTADQLQRALPSWQWLGVDGLAPRAVTLFGDLVLEGRGGWWFLSTLEGTLSRPWSSQQECEATLASEDGQQDYLGAGLIDLARQAGLTLERDEVVGFCVPPLFGGGFDPDNLRPTKFLVVHLFMARLHEHARESTSRAPFSAIAAEAPQQHEAAAAVPAPLPT